MSAPFRCRVFYKAVQIMAGKFIGGNMKDNYKELFSKALELVQESYKAQGKENDASLWLCMRYFDSEGETITVDVPSKFMWHIMNEKGIVKDVTEALKTLCKESSALQSIAINISITPRYTGESLVKEDTNILQYAAANCPSTGTKSGIPPLLSTSPDAVYRNVASNTSSFSSPIASSSRLLHSSLRREFTFDTFVPGENSEYAYNVCMAAAKDPGKRFNPILLYGGVGLGKTHLMQAIGNYIYQHTISSPHPPRIVCVSAEQFGTEFTNLFKGQRASKEIDKFKEKYRQCDVLLLDDIHFLQDKSKMQDELFYTFNALRDKDKQLVFTCDRPISQLRNVVDRLQSRLSNGQCVDLRAPKYDVRCAILEKKLSTAGRTVEEGVIEYIASFIETNVRDLESALNKVLGYAEMTGKKVDVDLARRLLQDMAPPTSLLTIEDIQEKVAKEYHVTVAELRGKKRDKALANARQVACYLCRELTESAFSDIGRAFGGRDHSTIIHACEVIEADRHLDGAIDDRITALISAIKASSAVKPR